MFLSNMYDIFSVLSIVLMIKRGINHSQKHLKYMIQIKIIDIRKKDVTILDKTKQTIGHKEKQSFYMELIKNAN